MRRAPIEMSLAEFQEASRSARASVTLPKPEQPEIPGTEHAPSAIELSIKPYAVKAAIARKGYQAAGRHAKEAVDALEAVIEHQGMHGKIINCGGGVVVRPEITEKLKIETPEGMDEWDDPSQESLDGTDGGDDE